MAPRLGFLHRAPPLAPYFVWTEAELLEEEAEVNQGSGEPGKMGGLRRRRRAYSRTLQEHIKPKGQNTEQHRNDNLGDTLLLKSTFKNWNRSLNEFPWVRRGWCSTKFVKSSQVWLWPHVATCKMVLTYCHNNATDYTAWFDDCICQLILAALCVRINGNQGPNQVEHQDCSGRYECRVSGPGALRWSSSISSVKVSFSNCSTSVHTDAAYWSWRWWIWVCSSNCLPWRRSPAKCTWARSIGWGRRVKPGESAVTCCRLTLLCQEISTLWTN